jgi:hypothetical protein
MVYHPDYGDFYALVHPLEEGLRIDMEKGVEITGKIRHDLSRSCLVSLCRLDQQGSPCIASDFLESNGSFDLGHVQKGDCLLKIEFREAQEREWTAEDTGRSSLVLRQTLRVGSQDLDLDFDLRKDAVTWRGSLFGIDDEICSHAKIMLHSTDNGLGFMLNAHEFTDAEGRFECKGLPKGEYSVMFRLQGSAQSMKNTKSIYLTRAGRFEQDLYLPASPPPEQPEPPETAMPSKGIVNIRITGLEEFKSKTLMACFTSEQKGMKDEKMRPPIHSDGTCHFTQCLEAGVWKAAFCAGNRCAESTFRIKPDELTEIILSDIDFKTDPRLILVKGRLTNEFEEPLAFKKIRFEAVGTTPKMKHAYSGYTLSNHQGYYELPCGIEPGTYSVFVTIGDTEMNLEEEKEVHEGRYEDDIDLMVKVSWNGIIRSKLLDARTGLPIESRENNFFPAVIFLVRASDGARIQECDPTPEDLKAKEGGFSIENIEPGTYYLRIKADGYMEYRTEPFEISSGQELYLDDIKLEPVAGEVKLEIYHPYGNSFLEEKEVEVSVEGISEPSFREKRTFEEQTTLCLPHGSFRIELEAEGYGKENLEVDIEEEGTHYSFPITMTPF